MTKEKYLTKAGIEQFRPVLSVKQMTKIMFGSEYKGFCINCGATRGECEPDARQYPCPRCKQNKVYAYEELMALGLIKFKD